MDDALYPSGEWVGYYIYEGKRTLFPMHLTLNFAQGCIQGAGVDRPGTFAIEGSYDDEGSRVAWVKRYIGKQSVHYEGVHRAGEIAGSWSLAQIAQAGGAPLHGEFRIWPPPADKYSGDEPLQSILEKEIRRKT